LPAELFGGFEPSNRLPAYFKAMGKRLIGDIAFDPSIYDRLRLWRLENSRHEKSGLYRVRLTWQEVQTLTIGEIETRAGQPRALPEEADDVEPNAFLTALWVEVVNTPEPARRERRP